MNILLRSTTNASQKTSGLPVAAGLWPAVEGGILPPGPAPGLSLAAQDIVRRWWSYGSFRRAGRHGSAAGGTPAATTGENNLHFINFFRLTAGALLLAMACTLFLLNLTGPVDLVTPHDPILGLSMNIVHWIVGGVSFAVALDCLFGERPFRPILLVAWLATNFLAYRLGLHWYGTPDLAGLLGGFPQAFGISARAANFLTQLAWGYLLIGSYATLWLLPKVGQASSLSLPAKEPAAAHIRFLKIPCTACGGRIEFPTNFFGEQIPCPHCRAVIILQKPVNLKMNCTSCDGHLAFPDYAVGQKIPCPHCQTEVTLKKAEIEKVES